METPLAPVVVRWAWLVCPAACLALVLAAHPPDRRAGAAAVVAMAWCFPALVAVNAAAGALGWWRFHAVGGVLLGTPIEALFGWSLLWGGVPALLLHRVRPLLVLALAAWIDLLAMPRCAPVLELGPHWLVGEVVALLIVLLPSRLLAGWTRGGRCLMARSALQAVAFGGIWFVVLPAALLSWRGVEPLAGVRGLWAAGGHPALLAVAGPALVWALAAVAEFAVRGGGTPLPLDPPERLVVSGPYAYVRNPMQLGATLLLLVVAAALASPWLAVAAGFAAIYSVGLAAWDEARDLGARFGRPYGRYRSAVGVWWPRWRPYREADATLYVAAGCGACEELARFLRWLRPTALQLVPAQRARRPLTRLTYRDGVWEEGGVAALGRALEHGPLPLATLGFAMRLPLLRPLLQLIADASGGHARAAPGGDHGM